MRRRPVLAGCALSATVAGCTDALSSDEPTDGDSSEESNERNDTDDEEMEHLYRIDVEAPVQSAEGEPVCEFEDLPTDARTEFTNAIDGADFETEQRAQYETETSPELLDTDCYNQYIEFEDEYYWVRIEVDGG